MCLKRGDAENDAERNGRSRRHSGRLGHDHIPAPRASAVSFFLVEIGRERRRRGGAPPHRPLELARPIAARREDAMARLRERMRGLHGRQRDVPRPCKHGCQHKGDGVESIAGTPHNRLALVLTVNRPGVLDLPILRHHSKKVQRIFSVRKKTIGATKLFSHQIVTLTHRMSVRCLTAAVAAVTMALSSRVSSRLRPSYR